MAVIVIGVTLIVLACVLLILVVLVQNPREGGLTAGFGAAFSSQFFGIQQAADFLEKATWVLVSIIAGLSILLNIYLYSRRETPIPAPAETPAPPAATEPVPSPVSPEGGNEPFPLSPPETGQP